MGYSEPTTSPSRGSLPMPNDPSLVLPSSAFVDWWRGKGAFDHGQVDATHYASYEFKVEGLPDSPVFPPDSSVG